MKERFYLFITDPIFICFVFVLLYVFCTSCSFIQGMGDVKSFSDMTSKEKATFLMATYNDQHESYVAKVNQVGLTEEDKEVLRVKYDVLNEIYPYINLYVNYAEHDTLPPEDVEDTVLLLLEKLITN